ncbi:gluconate 2-dehydrogenase subunit 3 family protein [Maribacter sp. MAR_2009_72]|uniref:gluconate 2-dehydrogenase subunit 3 family protein n=1 Tax=Maribacter sp. MAR_2009_72 TaxID=1250050 RepID=UPI00119BDDC9|nr:gluconate 2-dehydrogenase subunit 3 family protein [Maribacter sp. MAR_2009_72]TVZ16346.1 gluconate 2-dehydrogenase subunit 3-like protein [Maribacter sp. MAR_2009_72]
MDRRRVLKNMGLSLGYMVATPTLIGLVQSCKSEPAITWTPEFLSQDQGAILTKLVDLILPKTDTPAASEVQVDVFIDKFANEVMEKEQQELFTMSMNKFVEKALADSGKENIADLTSDDLEPVLASSLKYSKEDQTKMQDAITSYSEALAEGKTSTLDDETTRFAFANNLRGLTIWGYKASEYVGEEVLAYLPVPGEYIACGDAQELTGGKDWSL